MHTQYTFTYYNAYTCTTHVHHNIRKELSCTIIPTLIKN